MKLKRDMFFRERGRNAKIIKVSCVQCGKTLFTYQKDGTGWLKRCYLNRIIEPEKYARLQYFIKEPKDLSNLTCLCGSILGSPMKYKDGRIAFHLIRGKFKRTNVK